MLTFIYNEKEARDLYIRLSQKGVKVKMYQTNPETYSWARQSMSIVKDELFVLVDSKNMETMIILAKSTDGLYEKLKKITKG